MTSSSMRKPNDQRIFANAWPLLLALGLFLLMTGSYAWSNEPASAFEKTNITVYKTETCGCCGKWVEHLEANDFQVEVKVVPETNSIRSLFGVPDQMASCHTATVGEYWVEGHVPADLIQHLVEQEPENIRGIAVPGMPPGSPGMESPNPSKYKILSIDNKGNFDVFAVRDGKKPE